MKFSARYLLLLLLGILILQTSVGQSQDEPQAVDDEEQNPPATKVAIISFGTAENPMEIGAFSESYLNLKLERAKQLGADVVVRVVLEQQVQ